jgi:hypothetical protein
MIAMRKSLSSCIPLLPFVAIICCIMLPPTFAFGASDGQGSVGEILVTAWLAIAAVYVIPSVVAFVRIHPSRWLIVLINLAFGGTVIGWFGALIWALSAVHRSPSGSHGGESGLNLFVNDPIQVSILPIPDEVPPERGGNVEQVSADLLRLKGLRNQGLVTAE